MVAVGAVIGKPDSTDALVLKAIETGEANVAISDSFFLELVDVMRRPYVLNLIKDKANAPAQAMSLGLNVGVMGFFMRPKRLDWPNLTDPKDGWVLDLALQAAIDYEDRNIYIISRDRGVRRAAPKSGFPVLTPFQFLKGFAPHFLRS